MLFESWDGQGSKLFFLPESKLSNFISSQTFSSFPIHHPFFFLSFPFLSFPFHPFLNLFPFLSTPLFLSLLFPFLTFIFPIFPPSFFEHVSYLPSRAATTLLRFFEPLGWLSGIVLACQSESFLFPRNLKAFSLSRCLTKAFT